MKSNGSESNTSGLTAEFVTSSPTGVDSNGWPDANKKAQGNTATNIESSASANLDSRYTKEGLASAIQVAAQRAGVSLRKVNIDDSEFPFLIGVATEPGDWPKLTEQLKTLRGYEFHGSVGDDTSLTLCTVPVRAYPADSAQSISRRMGARLESFYHDFSATPVTEHLDFGKQAAGTTQRLSFVVIGALLGYSRPNAK